MGRKRYYETLTRQQADRLRQAIDAELLPQPSRGQNLGRGPHVDLDATGPDGDRTYAGWTTRECDVVGPETGTGALLVLSDRAHKLSGRTLPVVGRVNFDDAADEPPPRFPRAASEKPERKPLPSAEPGRVGVAGSGGSVVPEAPRRRSVR